MITTRMHTPIDYATELNEIEHVNAFIDRLSDDDIGRIIGDGLSREPIKPFKPIY